MRNHLLLGVEQAARRSADQQVRRPESGGDKGSEFVVIGEFQLEVTDHIIFISDRNNSIIPQGFVGFF